MVLGSRLMHLIIGEMVASCLDSILDKRAFLIGSIAPDASYGERKNITHFFEGDIDKGTRQINYHQYMENYLSEAKDDYAIGYLTHLIADYVWMEHIYYPYGLKQKQELDPEFLHKWHSDFRKLNTKLICHYNYENLKEQLVIKDAPREIEDITIHDLQNLIEEMAGDFNIVEQNRQCELEVYRFDDIIEYISLSKTKAIAVLEENGLTTA